MRSATPADAPAWLAMRIALWPESPEDHAPEIEKYFGGELRMPAEVLLAFDGDRAVGLVELSFRPYAEGCVTDPVAYLEGWYVVPEARRLGVGRVLMVAAEDWARGQGCTEFASDALVDNAISWKAHLALGFAETEVIRCFRKGL
ncbi:MAG: aminoglycoside 6'-N-acetyltransferase [Gemmatimonadales bacterium]